MSYFKGLFESLGAFLSGWGGGGADEPLPIVHGRGNQTMESALPSVENDRVVHKLKAYFELAKEEIAKAVRAEEWGLVDDAILHYKNAQRVLLEAKATRVPPLVSSSNQEQAKTYHKKILKWEGQVLERLQVLSQRADATLAAMSTNKTSLNNAPTRAVPAARSGPKKAILSKPSYSQINNSVPMKRGDITGSSRSNKEAGNDYDAKLVETINSVIVDRSPSVKWEDIAGLEKAKQTLLEMVILPTKRRDLFTGLRKPARGLLLFGPPGNGKTMLAKAVASESEATFFNVSASTLTSKWVGEAEKLVRSLFTVAVARQPSVIFIDEIDSILSARMANENDASRRLKSEFLVQFDGVTSSANDLVIVIGATNKPQELDDAVLRRLVKRIYVPLPNVNVRRLLLKHQLKGQAFSLPDGDLERLVKETEVYSGSDLQALCEEAALMPIRELGPNILTVKANQVRRLRYEDFQKSISVIRPSLSKSMKEELEKWNEEFGSN